MEQVQLRPRPNATLPVRANFAASPHKTGAEGQNRTADTAIFSRVLYRLSYLGLLARGLGQPAAFESIDNPTPWFSPPPRSLSPSLTDGERAGGEVTQPR